MKQLFITLLSIAVISSAWFIYQCGNEKQTLQKALAAKSDELAALEKEITELKKSLADAEQQARSEPTIDSLVDDANSVLKESLDTALKGVQSELDRVKNTLNQELEKLRLDKLIDNELDQSKQSGENEARDRDSTGTHKKHST